MDRRIQVALSVAIIAALILAGAYAAGWFRKTSTAEITCSITHHEGNQGISYKLSVGPSLEEVASEEFGEIGPGEITEVTVVYEWDGRDPRIAYVDFTLAGYISGEHKVILADSYIEVIPDGEYRIECHIYLLDNATNHPYREDVCVLYPVRVPSTFSSAGILELNLTNQDLDDLKRVHVLVDGDWRASCVLGPHSSRGLSIPVGWYSPLPVHTRMCSSVLMNPRTLHIHKLWRSKMAQPWMFPWQSDEPMLQSDFRLSLGPKGIRPD